MAMPIDLVLVRHGESEGNVKKDWEKEGSIIPPDFFKRHTADWRLTSLGVKQAEAASSFIKENIGNQFDRYITSNYVRARETAAILDLPDALWYEEPFICERNWGLFDRFTAEERAAKFEKDIQSKEIHPFYWAPPRGESLNQLCLRVKSIIDTIYRECEGQKVIIVCHGEVMWAFRIRLERIPIDTYLAMENNLMHKIYNCQIIHYSRRNPFTGEHAPYLNWYRFVNPMAIDNLNEKWQQINRKKFSNQELLAAVQKIPRIIDND